MNNDHKLLSIKEKKIAIICATYQEAKQLMGLFARNRITWRLGVSAENKTNWEKDGADTCYVLDYVGIAYSHKYFYEEKGYEIIPFKDFLVEPIKEGLRLKKIVFRQTDSKYGPCYQVYIGDQYIGEANVDPNHKDFPKMYDFKVHASDYGFISPHEFEVKEGVFPENLEELRIGIERDFSNLLETFYE